MLTSCGCQHRDHPVVNVDDMSHEESGSVCDGAERGGPHARPRKPMPQMVFGFPAQQLVTEPSCRGIDLEDDDAAVRDEVCGPPQCPDRVAADADIPVGEQDLFPAT